MGGVPGDARYERKTVVLVAMLLGFGFAAFLNLPRAGDTEEAALAMVAQPVTQSIQSARTRLPSQASKASQGQFLQPLAKIDPHMRCLAATQTAQIQAYSPFNGKKYETLSYLPQLTNEAIRKQIDFMIKNQWTPSLEFSDDGDIYLNTAMGPCYYDNRYWSMYKLPMFGCSDSNDVIREIETCKRDYPNAKIRVIGFDPKRQVQTAGFIVRK